MRSILKASSIKTLVNYLGINEIVSRFSWKLIIPIKYKFTKILGALCLIHSISMIRNFSETAEVPQSDIFYDFRPYYYFLLVAAVLSLFKGPLLIYSVKKVAEKIVVAVLIFSF